jgi:hypothetical protein
MQLQKLMDFINQLEAQSLYYSMTSVRSDAILVEVHKPGTGMRYEIEFFTNGQVMAEIFQSHGTLSGDEALARVLA